MRCSTVAVVVGGVVLALAPAARAADKAAVDAAVARAVAYLKSTQQSDGTWRRPKQDEFNVPGASAGATALAGLALLVADAPPTDPAVQKAAQAVREQSPKATATYVLSLMIMFLDRLGDPA